MSLPDRIFLIGYMRVCDPSKGVDLVFNFGVFNFNTDNFVFKFIKGETDYVLAVYDFNTFLPEYRERNSTVWEQVLNLSVAEKKELVRLLFENNQPENRVYRYNFIYDNCATRPRDKVLESLDGKVIYKTAPLYKTFREWVGEYIGYDTCGLGIRSGEINPLLRKLLSEASYLL